MKNNSSYRFCTGAASLATLVLFLSPLPSCRKAERRFETDAVTNRAAMPVLATHDVTTLVSDSGVTRYRIKAASWMIYDKAEPSYWEFPDGIYLEKFDSDMHIDASLQADYAYYNEKDEIWELRGHVHALNLQGEQFDTPLLFWNQRKERVWSDSTITIRKARTIITGVGFESNQEMTQYTIQHPTGIIPIENEEE